MTGYAARRRIDHDQALAMAWHVEAFARMKKLPPLKRVLGRGHDAPVAAQEPDAMIASLRTFALIQNEKVKGRRP